MPAFSETAVDFKHCGIAMRRLNSVPKRRRTSREISYVSTFRIFSEQAVSIPGFKKSSFRSTTRNHDGNENFPSAYNLYQVPEVLAILRHTMVEVWTS